MNPFYEAMQEVLERPQYDILTGRAVDYQQMIMEAIGRAIISLLEQVNLSMPDSASYNLQAITFIFVVIAALLLLAASMGITYFLLKRMGRKAKQEASVSALFDDIAHQRFTLSDLLRISREFEEKRQFRDAVRHHYIAVLVALNDKHAIQVDRSKTNAQLLKELASTAPALNESFVSVVDVFHSTWFGKKDIEEEAYRRFAACAEDFL